MKRSLLILLGLILALFVLASPNLATGTDNIKIILDGKELETDVPPIIEEGRTLAPMRVVFEALGCKIDWRPQERAVVASTDSIMLLLKIDDTEAALFDKLKETRSNITLDVPARIVDGRTMVPLRFIATSLDCKVDWRKESRTVNITTNSNPTVKPNPGNSNGAYADFPQVPSFGTLNGVTFLRKEEAKAVVVPFAEEILDATYYYYDSTTANNTKVVESYGQLLRNWGFVLFDSKYDNSQGSYMLTYKKGELYVSIENTEDYFRIIIAKKPV